MAEEWVCEDCGHVTSINPGGECPECGGKMVHFGDELEELSENKKEKYDKDELETPLEPKEQDPVL